MIVLLSVKYSSNSQLYSWPPDGSSHIGRMAGLPQSESRPAWHPLESGGEANDAADAVRDSGLGLGEPIDRAEPGLPEAATAPPDDDADRGSLALKRLVEAQRHELASQHSDCSLLRSALSNSEAERAKLLRLVADLTAERDSYLAGMTEASERLAVTREAASRADEAHTRERKDDTRLFQANLQRLLVEKAQLHEEVEAIGGQKDALTEALVKANHALLGLQQMQEERDTWRTQHADAAERLQRAHAERVSQLTKAAAARERVS